MMAPHLSHNNSGITSMRLGKVASHVAAHVDSLPQNSPVCSPQPPPQAPCGRAAGQMTHAMAAARAAAAAAAVRQPAAESPWAPAGHLAQLEPPRVLTDAQREHYFTEGWLVLDRCVFRSTRERGAREAE